MPSKQASWQGPEAQALSQASGCIKRHQLRHKAGPHSQHSLACGRAHHHRPHGSPCSTPQSPHGHRAMASRRLCWAARLPAQLLPLPPHLQTPSLCSNPSSSQRARVTASHTSLPGAGHATVLQSTLIVVVGLRSAPCMEFGLLRLSARCGQHLCRATRQVMSRLSCDNAYAVLLHVVAMLPCISTKPACQQTQHPHCCRPSSVSCHAHACLLAEQAWPGTANAVGLLSGTMGIF